MKFVGLLLFILYLLCGVESNSYSNETCLTHSYDTITYNWVNFTSTKTQVFNLPLFNSSYSQILTFIYFIICRVFKLDFLVLLEFIMTSFGCYTKLQLI